MRPRYTRRFVESPVPKEPMRRAAMPKQALQGDHMLFGVTCARAMEAQGKLTRGFIGAQHIEVTGPKVDMALAWSTPRKPASERSARSQSSLFSSDIRKHHSPARPALLSRRLPVCDHLTHLRRR